MEVFKNQEDCPNYLALKDRSILTNWKSLEEIFFKLCFKKRAIVTPGSGDTPYIMALYGAGGSALKGYYFKYMKKYRDFTSWGRSRLLLVEVYKRVEKSVILICKKAQKG